MTKGINVLTLPAGTPLLEIARLGKAAGFDAIEPAMLAEGELTPSSDESICRSLGDRIRGKGLEVSSLMGGVFWQVPFTSPDPAVRQQAMELAIAGLERARWMGAPVLLLIPGVVGRWNAKQPVIRYEDALMHAYDAFRVLVYEAESRGVMIAIENVWNRFLLSPVEMREFIDRISSAWLRVYFDIGNVLRTGYPQDWIEALGSRIIRVHARDYRLDVGTNQGFCMPGDGDVDWPEVMAALRRIRYDGPIIYEGAGDLNEISKRLDQIMGRA